VTDFDGAVTIGATFDDVVANQDDDVNPIEGLIENNNLKHMDSIKELDKLKTKNYFERIRHMKQIRDTYKLRPLHKLVLNSLNEEDLKIAKRMLPHLFPGQVGAKRKTRKHRKSKKSKNHKRHTKNRK
jgi:hypothetical protein